MRKRPSQRAHGARCIAANPHRDRPEIRVGDEVMTAVKLEFAVLLAIYIVNLALVIHDVAVTVSSWF